VSLCSHRPHRGYFRGRTESLCSLAIPSSPLAVALHSFVNLRGSPHTEALT
jgi:hypothetical protein